MAQKTSVKDNESDGRAVVSKMLEVDVFPWKIKNVQRDMIGMPPIRHEEYKCSNDARSVITNGKNKSQCFSYHGVIPDAYFIVPSGAEKSHYAVNGFDINTRVHTLVAVEIVHTNDLTKEKLLRYGDIWFDFDGSSAWDLGLAVVYMKGNGLPPQIVSVDLMEMSYMAFHEHAKYMRNEPRYAATIEKIIARCE